jgi:DNA invertase Pin-like site-specific DNA recombinase
MKNIVLYIRYSSTGQNEQTVEGQIRVCKEWAEQNGYVVVGVYIDKAKSVWSDSDKRVEFHKMLNEAGSGKFQYILVYKFDRFARNRLDSQMHKQRLRKEFGIRVLSATEPVRDDEGGEIYEMFLEWNDEKYSQRLSKRVRDGLTTSVANGTFCGGSINFGYKIRKEQVGTKDRYIKYVDIDEQQAEIVRYVFAEYAKGVSKQDIAKELNQQGHLLKGKPFKAKNFDLWLKNEKYTGEFSFGGRRCGNMYPSIIDRKIFDKCQARLTKNKYFAGANSSKKEPYLLTGKLECGYCNTDMVADGGTGKLGKVHYYYACKKKKKDLCTKKREHKNTLESLAVARAVQYLKDPKRANAIIDENLRYHEQRTSDDGLKSIDTKITHLTAEIEKLTTSFIDAKSKLLRETIEKRMSENEILLDDLNAQKRQIEFEKSLKVTKQDLLKYIDELIKGDPNDKAYQKRIIDNLIYKVVVYDNKLRIFINLKGGTEIAEFTPKQADQAESQAIRVQTQCATPRQKGSIRTIYCQKLFWLDCSV